jgi:hypothetical protein
LTIGLGILSCRQIVGFDESQRFRASADAGARDAGANDASACGLPYGSGACAACVQASCCAELTACAADTACAPFVQCFGACGTDDWACRAQCWTDHHAPPSGPTAAPGALEACLTSTCATACGLSCGTVVVQSLPDAAAGCAQCLTTNGSCPDERACASSEECSNAGACWTDCFWSIDCGCTPSTEAGVALYNAAGRGLKACGTACGIGVNWSCVGHLSWPEPTPNGSTFTVDVLDLISYQGLSGVDVSACYAADPGCSAPSGHGVTDAGVAMFPVAPALVGHGLEANNYLQLTLPGTVPALFYWGFPVSQPSETFGDAVGTQAEWAQFFGRGDQTVTWDTSRGIVVFNAPDCTNYGSSVGVQVALEPTDPLIRKFYGSPPSFAATETNGTGLRPYLGFGGFVNVPPGTVSLTATPRAIGKVSSQATVYVRQGTVTFVILHPTP